MDDGLKRRIAFNRIGERARMGNVLYYLEVELRLSGASMSLFDLVCFLLASDCGDDGMAKLR